MSITGLSASEAARNLDLLRTQLAAAPEAEALQPLGLGGVVLGPGAVESVPSLVGELRNGSAGEAVLLADCRAMAGGDPDLKTAIARALEQSGVRVRRVTIGDEHARVHLDAPTLDDAAALTAGADILVSVGSGSVVDVGKAVAARIGLLPHVAVQTAGSVNGFADDQSVLLVDGVKRTTPTSWPDRLVIDTEVVAQAPAELNRAGLGDLLATYTAPADWLLASLVGQDTSYSPTVVALARAYVDPAVDAAPGIGRGEVAAVESLVASLTLSGISMGVAGRTSPCSGMEHTVSHLLEMAEKPGEPSALHGAKVGALAVVASLLWERVRDAARAGALRALQFPDESTMRAQIDAAFRQLDESGAMARECSSDYSRKLARWHEAAPSLRTLEERWPAFDAELDGLLTPSSRLIEALRAAGAPIRLSELGVDAARLRWALTNCHLMRDRFTVADLAFFMGIWTDTDVVAFLDDATRLGAGA